MCLCVGSEEASIIDGALTYGDLKVKDVMTPIREVFLLPLSGHLDIKVMVLM